MTSDPPCPDRIDVQRPDAPALAAYGAHDVGVRTIDLVAHDRPDLREPALDRPVGRYDRRMRVEVWYPAVLPAGVARGGTYLATTPDGTTRAALHGRAVRDAPPATGGAPFPLVIVSHGYPGNRYLLSHLTENLASKGFVVASIDHPESTYEDRGAFASTLYHRPLDQRFVLDEMARLGADEASFLSGRLDASRAAIVGYSMGGYGALLSVGGGLTASAVELPFAPPERLLAQHEAGSDALEARRDPRIAAVIAIAPWGMNVDLWDVAGLAGIRTPVLVVAGSADDVSGYEHGVRAIFEGAVNAERSLLTFVHANHGVAAPIPAPRAAWETGTFDHYADPVWDTVRMNNVLQHFATAFLRRRLHGDAAMDRYLDLVPDAADGVWAIDDDGTARDEHTYWAGFANRTAAGLRFETGRPER